ncbi:hypothetical protein VTI74DRAFT_10451 [Chaetomium olivicolor]
MDPNRRFGLPIRHGALKGPPHSSPSRSQRAEAQLMDTSQWLDDHGCQLPSQGNTSSDSRRSTGNDMDTTKTAVILRSIASNGPWLLSPSSTLPCRPTRCGTASCGRFGTLPSHLLLLSGVKDTSPMSEQACMVPLGMSAFHSPKSVSGMSPGSLPLCLGFPTPEQHGFAVPLCQVTGAEAAESTKIWWCP